MVLFCICCDLFTKQQTTKSNKTLVLVVFPTWQYCITQNNRASGLKNALNSPSCVISDIMKCVAHHPTTSVVVEVHQCAGIFHHTLPGIDEGFGKFYSIVDVVTASAPVVGASVVTVLPTLVIVASANLQFPQTTCRGDCVDHSCRGHGIHKRCLSTACTHVRERSKQYKKISQMELFSQGFTNSLIKWMATSSFYKWSTILIVHKVNFPLNIAAQNTTLSFV